MRPDTLLCGGLVLALVSAGRQRGGAAHPAAVAGAATAATAATAAVTGYLICKRLSLGRLRKLERLVKAVCAKAESADEDPNDPYARKVDGQNISLESCREILGAVKRLKGAVGAFRCGDAIIAAAKGSDSILRDYNTIRSNVGRVGREASAFFNTIQNEVSDIDLSARAARRGPRP